MPHAHGIAEMDVNDNPASPPAALSNPRTMPDHMARQEREILERAVRAVSEQAAAASSILDEAVDAGLDGSTLSPSTRRRCDSSF